MTDWTTKNIPSQQARFALITGATGGLGYDTALALARAGATVMLTGRSEAKGQAALAAIRKIHPRADIRFDHLDLASLSAIREFADRLAAEDQPIDLLINNAGVMALPERQTTSDDFEMQFGTNYLGHFALTGSVLPLLRLATRPRVIQLSSIAHRGAKIDFDNLQGERRYSPWGAYKQSKLAMLTFALELQRRSDSDGWGIMSVAAHPGWSRTDLISNGPASAGGSTIRWTAAKILEPFLSQSSAAGALPTLYAATSPDVQPAGYYGPSGFQELKGAPKRATIDRAAIDPATASRLWEVSTALTGVRFSS